MFGNELNLLNFDPGSNSTPDIPTAHIDQRLAALAIIACRLSLPHFRLNHNAR